MMVDMNLMRVMEILSHATNRIAEGEVLQLLNCNDPDTTEAKYMEVIKRKTATLFEAGTRLGAVLADRPAYQEQAMADYGLHLGIAFQLVDDALDYSSSNETLGKNVGDDLAEGKPTLPLIQAMAVGNPQQRAAIRKAIEEGGRDQIDSVLHAIESTDAIAYTAALAQKQVQLAKDALDALPASPYTEALRKLADFAVSRTY
jgi:octaprenyl-diphosphate synthase